MTRLSEIGLTPLLLGLTLLSVSGSLMAITCPDGQYTYGGCSSCFSIVEQPSSFEVAAQTCQQKGGQLLIIEDSYHFELLGRYLEGIQEGGPLWVGYRYISDGSRVDLEGQLAPAVVLDNGNFVVGETSGNDLKCVGVRGTSLSSLLCTQSLPSLCLFTYGVPKVSLSPESGIIYTSLSEMNFELTATVTIPEAISVTAQWRLNKTVITHADNSYTVRSKRGSEMNERVFSLMITSTNSNPLLLFGMYEFLVESLAGVAVSAFWHLKKPVLGAITIQPQDLELPTGQIAGFECKAENATPSTTVTWFKDSVILDPTRDTRHHVSDITGTLFIRDIGVNDSGLYHCVCENIAGNITSRQATLVILEALQVSQEMQSSFFIHPRHMTRLVGQPYNLECVGLQFVDLDVSSYRFHFNSELEILSPNQAFDYPSDRGFPIYRIEELSLDDSSRFVICSLRPREFHGFELIGSTHVVSLTVESLPSVDQLSTSVENGETETDSELITIQNASDVTIQCHFSGVPLPTIEWTRDGEPITVGVVTFQYVSTLNVSGLDSSAIYQCLVSNKHGTDTDSVSLCYMEESIPGPVQFLVEPDSNTTIFISWDIPFSPNHPALLRYLITIMDVGMNTETMYKPLPGVNHFIASGLSPSTVYRVHMIATSLLGPGEGDPDSYVFLRTFDNPPIEPISTLSVQRTEDNSALIIQWTFMGSANVSFPPLPDYVIQYGRMDLNSTMTVTVMGNESLHVVDSLMNAADYEARIRVRTQTQRSPLKFILGPWSEYVAVTGVTTLPPRPTTQPNVPPSAGIISIVGLLLLYILVPLGVVLLIVISAGVLMIWFCFKHRKNMSKRKYSPASEERVVNVSGTCTLVDGGGQRPMGNQIFDLPLNNYASNVWLGNKGFTPQFSPQPSEEGAPSATQEIPNQFTTFVSNRDVPSATPSMTPPQEHNPSGTVTITYLTPVPQRNNGNSYRDLTDSNCSREKLTETSSRISDSYDTLDPDPDFKENLNTNITFQASSTSLASTPEIDFKILEDLAVESAALASKTGTPDPYALPPTNDEALSS